MSHSLGGKSVLIVEDEMVIGLMLSREIVRAGGTSVGPVASVARALQKIDSHAVDVVVLDAKLIDGSGADLIDRLKERRIPYVVVSGYEEANLPRGLSGAPFVAKPISVPLLMATIGGLDLGRATAQPLG